MSKQIEFSPKYEPLFYNASLNNGGYCDVTIVTGGRGSAKSSAASCGLSIDLNSGLKTNIIWLRFTLSSIENSSYKEFDHWMTELGIRTNFNKNGSKLIHKTNGNEIWFTGVKTSSGDNTAKLKSLKGYNVAVFEEAEEFTDKETFDKIKLSIRANDAINRIIIIMNPALKTHWIYDEYFKKPGVDETFNGVKNGVRYIYTTYEDNVSHDENGKLVYNLPESMIREYERIKESDPSYYKRVILGAWHDRSEGALWKPEWISQNRVSECPNLDAIFVSGDPAVSNKDSSDETGIIVAGLRRKWRDGKDHVFILDDGSCKASAEERVNTIIRLYHKHDASGVYYENNQGGDWIEALIRTCDPGILIESQNSRKSKEARALPVAGWYQQGLVHHVGSFPELESQMCTWNPADRNAKSPDRVDALTQICNKYLKQNKQIFFF